jgi:hypothetical protein
MRTATARVTVLEAGRRRRRRTPCGVLLCDVGRKHGRRGVRVTPVDVGVSRVVCGALLCDVGGSMGVTA